MNIRPELIAGKIESGWLERAAQRNPRYTPEQVNELLWFLQTKATRTDGFASFVGELLALYPEQFGNDAMLKIGRPPSDRYSLEQCLAIWQAVETKHVPNHEHQQDDDGEFITGGPKREFIRRLKQNGSESMDFAAFASFFLDANITAGAVHQNTQYDRDVILAALERFNWQHFTAHYQNQAERLLPKYLQQLCEDPQTPLCNASYCPDLVGLLFRHMERTAADASKTIAETEVTRRVFRELDFARSQNVPVPIVGESRIGKTSPAAAWCNMHPGRARLVTVPDSNRMRDFIEAHADAFGIEHTLGTSTTSLTATVKYVHQHSGLMVCYDESAFLVPVRYSKSTPPARINYVRCQVIDRGLPVAFFATPQSYKQTLDQYVKTTGYRIEQWLGRLAPAVILPSDLGKTDLMEIARKHFPHLAEPYLKLIIARAMQSEGYIKNMEFAAKRALFNAQQSGRSEPSLDDVQLAIEEMMPHSPAPAPAPRPVRTASAAPLPKPRAATADAPQNRLATPAPAPDPDAHEAREALATI